MITEAREAARHVFFPVGAVRSLVTPLADRSAVEVATVGNEGLVGLAGFLKTGWMPSRVFVQVPGRALRIDAETIAAGTLQRAGLIRYTGGEITVVDRSGPKRRRASATGRCGRRPTASSGHRYAPKPPSCRA